MNQTSTAKQLEECSSKWFVELKDLQARFLQECNEIIHCKPPFTDRKAMEEELLKAFSTGIDGLSLNQMSSPTANSQRNNKKPWHMLLKGYCADLFFGKCNSLIRSFTSRLFESLDKKLLHTKPSEILVDSSMDCSEAQHIREAVRVRSTIESLQGATCGIGSHERDYITEMYVASRNNLHTLQEEHAMHCEGVESDFAKVVNMLQNLENDYHQKEAKNHESVICTVSLLELNQQMQKQHVADLECALTSLHKLWSAQANLQSDLRSFLQEEAYSSTAKTLVVSEIRSVLETLKESKKFCRLHLFTRRIESALWQASRLAYQLVDHIQEKHRHFLSHVQATCNGFLVKSSDHIHTILWQKQRGLKQQSRNKRLAEIGRLCASAESSPSETENDCSRQMEDDVNTINQLQEYHALLFTTENTTSPNSE